MPYRKDEFFLLKKSQFLIEVVPLLMNLFFKFYLGLGPLCSVFALKRGVVMASRIKRLYQKV